jgi:hypothetical protein
MPAGLDSEENLRFAVGMTLWYLGLAEAHWPTNPVDPLWDLVVDRSSPARGAQDWILSARAEADRTAGARANRRLFSHSLA